MKQAGYPLLLGEVITIRGERNTDRKTRKFITSGDDGYLEENPDTPTKPDKPEQPTEPENPDKPETPDEPGEHTHEYVFDAVVRENEKTMTVSYLCECGDNHTEFIKVEFTSAEDGSGVVLIPGENGELDFAVLEGKYTITVTNDNGEELMFYEVTLAKNEPIEPAEPVTPDKPSEEKPGEDKPSEPETPDTPSDSKTDKPTDKGNAEKEEKKTSAAGILLPILFVLGIGAVVTLVVLKKKNGKNKKSNDKKEQK